MGHGSDPEFEPAPRRRSSGGDPDSRPGLVWAAAVSAGLLAALASWAAGEATLEAFVPPAAAMKSGPMGTMTPAARAALAVARGRNTALAYGLSGAIVGLLLGPAGGLAGGRIRGSFRAAILGLILGGVAAAGLSLALTPIYLRSIDPDVQSLALPLAIRGAIWMAIGAAGGLAFGLGLEGRSRGFAGWIGGTLGAMLGTLTYVAIYATAFPLVPDHQVIPATRVLRLLAMLCVIIMAALGWAWGVRSLGRAANRPS